MGMFFAVYFTLSVALTVLFNIKIRRARVLANAEGIDQEVIEKVDKMLPWLSLTYIAFGPILSVIALVSGSFFKTSQK